MKTSGGICNSRRRCLVGMLLLILLIFSQCVEMALGESSRKVRVGIFQNEPIVFQDEQGVAKGLYVDLLDAISEKEGWELTYVLDTWAGCLERLRSGDLDLMTSIAQTAQRDTFADFSQEVVWTLWGVVFIRPDAGVEDVLGLEGKRIALLENEINGINFAKLCNEFGVVFEAVYVPTYDAAFRATEEGQVDAAVANSVFGTMHGAEYRLKRSSIIFSPVNAYIAVPDGRNADLLVTFDEYLQEWKQNEDSVYYQTLNKWLIPKQPSAPIVPRWIWVVLIILAAVALCAFIWVWVLRRAVDARTAELRISEKRFRSLYENAPYGIVFCELIVDDDEKPIDFIHLQANAATAVNTGINVNQLVGKKASEMVSPEELSVLLRTYGDVVATRRSASYTRHFAVYDRTVEVASFHLEGRLFIINFIDVSDRVQAVKEIEQHRDGLEKIVEERTLELSRLSVEQRLILDTIRATMWYKDTKNNVLRVNKAAAESVGLAVEDIEGKATEELFPEEAAKYYQDDREVMQTKRPKLGIVEQLRTASGDLRWVLTDKIPIMDESGVVTGIIAFTIDITEQKRTEEKLERRSEELRAIVRGMAGRENRMVELKNVVQRLRAQLKDAGIVPKADDPLQGGAITGEDTVSGEEHDDAMS